MERFRFERREYVHAIEYYSMDFEQSELDSYNEQLKELFECEDVTVPFRPLTMEEVYHIANDDNDDLDSYIVDNITFTRHYTNYITNELSTHEYSDSIFYIVQGWLNDDIWGCSTDYEVIDGYDQDDSIYKLD